MLYGLLVWVTNTERWRELSVIWFVGMDDKHREMERAQCYMVCWCGGQTLRDGESSVLHGLLVWIMGREAETCGPCCRDG